MSYAFANRARQLIIRPGSGAGLPVGRNIGSHDQQVAVVDEHPGGAVLPECRRYTGLKALFGQLGVTIKAVRDGLDQVLTSRTSFRRALKPPIR